MFFSRRKPDEVFLDSLSAQTNSPLLEEEENREIAGLQVVQVDLILQSESEEILLRVDKKYLAERIPYFKALFTFPGKEDWKKFSIQVPEARVAKLFLEDIIACEDPQAEEKKVAWTPRQKLQLVKLKSFLSLDIGIADLYNLALDKEDFPLLLEVISLPEAPGVDSDLKLRRMVKRNIPENYSWEGVDKEFVESITSKINVRMITGGKELGMYDIITGECLQVFQGHERTITQIVVTEDQRRMFSRCRDNIIRLWDLENGACLQVFRSTNKHFQMVMALVLIDGRERLVSSEKGDFNNYFKVWDIESGQCLKTYADDNLENIIMITSQGIVLSSSFRESVRMWNIKKSRGFLSRVLLGNSNVQKFQGHSYSCYAAALTKDTKRLITGSHDETLRSWKVETGECLQVYRDHGRAVIRVLLTKDEKRFISLGGNIMKMWDVESGQCLWEFKAGDTVFSSAAISADQGRIFTTSQDGKVRIWNLKKGELLHVYDNIPHSESIFLLDD